MHGLKSAVLTKTDMALFKPCMKIKKNLVQIYSYEVNGKLVTGNGSLIPISSLTKHSLLPSLTVVNNSRL